jgi:hypothetical protein
VGVFGFLLLLLATIIVICTRFTYLSSHGVINISSSIIIIMIVSRQLLICILTLLLSLLIFIIRITQSSVWLMVTSNFHTNASVTATAIGIDIKSLTADNYVQFILTFSHLSCSPSNFFFITKKINYYDNISFSHK